MAMPTKPKKPDACMHCALIDAWQKAHGEVPLEVVVISLMRVAQQTLCEAADLTQYPGNDAPRPGEPVH